ncbi:MAG: 4-(cytidine 5'-diphospho)-2-C-methyl-D-erythritol kinase [Planctomycetota bacterium]
MKELTRLSPAKINLTLRVIARRGDGFHEIESLVTRVGLHDRITVSLVSDEQWTVTCSDPEIPGDERNLAFKAARLLAKNVNYTGGVRIHIEKNIPASAGLGGGSSNAATVLMALNELWKAGLSPAELARIGSSIGSDVPLFLQAQSCCIIRGRGELITEVPQALRGWAVLFIPALHCATPQVYAEWDRTTPAATRPTLEQIMTRINDPAALRELLFNDLEEPAHAAYPELARVARYLTDLCGPGVRMTGSGSAFYYLTESEEEARRVVDSASPEESDGVRTVCVSIPD